MTGHIKRIVKAHVTCDEEGCGAKVEAYVNDGGTTEARARAKLKGWTRSPSQIIFPVKDFCPRHGL